MTRTLALTPQLVAKVHRHVPDPGTDVDFTYASEQQIAETRDALLARAKPEEDVWLFAFGSLIWRPECPTVEQRPALLKGWHRSFCMVIESHRGSREQPGLMMALDKGGEVTGVIQRVAAKEKAAALDALLWRETPDWPPTQPARWLEVESQGEKHWAITFAMDPASSAYAGGLSLEQKAEMLSCACGHWGSGAEYLMNTVSHLAQLGIHDPYLWDLQERVAKKIVERHGL